MDLYKEMNVRRGGATPDVEESLVDLVGGHALGAEGNSFSKSRVIIAPTKKMPAASI